MTFKEFSLKFRSQFCDFSPFGSNIYNVLSPFVKHHVTIYYHRMKYFSLSFVIRKKGKNIKQKLKVRKHNLREFEFDS